MLNVMKDDTNLWFDCLLTLTSHAAFPHPHTTASSYNTDSPNALLPKDLTPAWDLGLSYVSFDLNYRLHSYRVHDGSVARIASCLLRAPCITAKLFHSVRALWARPTFWESERAQDTLLAGESRQLVEGKKTLSGVTNPGNATDGFTYITYWPVPSGSDLMVGQLIIKFVNEMPMFFQVSVQHRAHKSPPMVPIRSHVNPVNALPSNFRNIYFNIIFPFTPASSTWSNSFKLSN
jgi:hypothetical protein